MLYRHNGWDVRVRHCANGVSTSNHWLGGGQTSDGQPSAQSRLYPDVTPAWSMSVSKYSTLQQRDNFP